MKRIDRNKNLLILIYIILILLTVIYFAFTAFKYELLYKEAIKQGAEGIVTALELNVACQSLGNFTIDEVKREWAEIFIIDKILLNKTTEDEK